MLFGDVFEYDSVEFVDAVIAYNNCKLLKKFPGYKIGSKIDRIYQRYKDGQIFFAKADEEYNTLWNTSDYFSLTVLNVD